MRPHLRALALLLAAPPVMAGCGSGTYPPNAVILPVTPCRHQSPTPPTPDGPTELSYIASLDPVARATEIAGSPQMGPPSRHPRYISKQRAIRMARQAGASEYSDAAPPSAPVMARLMTMPEFDARLGEGWDYSVNPRRKLWIVTIHARWVNTEAARAGIYGVYTVVIDAESGRQFGFSAGCDPFARG